MTRRLLPLGLFLAVAGGYFALRVQTPLVWNDTVSLCGQHYQMNDYLDLRRPGAWDKILQLSLGGVGDGYRPLSALQAHVGYGLLADPATPLWPWYAAAGAVLGAMAVAIFFVARRFTRSDGWALLAVVLLLCSPPIVTGSWVVVVGLQAMVPLLICTGLLCYWAFRDGRGPRWLWPVLLAVIMLAGPWFREFVGLLPVLVLVAELQRTRRPTGLMLLAAAGLAHAIFPSALVSLFWPGVPVRSIFAMGLLGRMVQANLGAGGPNWSERLMAAIAWEAPAFFLVTFPPTLLVLAGVAYLASAAAEAWRRARPAPPPRRPAVSPDEAAIPLPLDPNVPDPAVGRGQSGQVGNLSHQMSGTGHPDPGGTGFQRVYEVPPAPGLLSLGLILGLLVAGVLVYIVSTRVEAAVAAVVVAVAALAVRQERLIQAARASAEGRRGATASSSEAVPPIVPRRIPGRRLAPLVPLIVPLLFAAGAAALAAAHRPSWLALWLTLGVALLAWRIDRFLAVWFLLAFLPFLKVFTEEVHLAYAAVPAAIVLAATVQRLWRLLAGPSAARAWLRAAAGLALAVAAADQAANVYGSFRTVTAMNDGIVAVADWLKAHAPRGSAVVTNAIYGEDIRLFSGNHVEPFWTVTAGVPDPARTVETGDKLRAFLRDNLPRRRVYFLAVEFEYMPHKVGYHAHQYVRQQVVPLRHVARVYSTRATYPVLDPLKTLLPRRLMSFLGAPDLVNDVYVGPARSGPRWLREVYADYELYEVLGSGS